LAKAIQSTFERIEPLATKMSVLSNLDFRSLKIEVALRNVEEFNIARKGDVDFVKQVAAEHGLSTGDLM
jgi:hypothetical protein